MSNSFGIDVAKWQGNINWAKVAADGKAFAILKVTDKSNKVESAFNGNYVGAKTAGLEIGVYRYVYAKTITAAKAEAEAIVANIKDKELDAGVWLDMEDSSIKGLGKEALTNIIEAEADIIEAAGFKVGIYCNRDWYLNILDSKRLAESFPFWIARYPTKDTGTYTSTSSLSPKDYAACWQYSSKGSVAGITGDVDLDVCFAGFSELFNVGPSYYDKYTGSGTLVEALAAVGEKDTSFVHRRKIAYANGIVANLLNYTGTIAQNNKMFALLRAGKLKKA